MSDYAAILSAALSAVSVFDREYVEDGPWQVVGPVREGTIDMATGERSRMRDAGYGINAVEPKKFGGTVIVPAGLTKAFADNAVKEHEEAIKPAWKKAAEQPAQEAPAKAPPSKPKKRKGKK